MELVERLDMKRKISFGRGIAGLVTIVGGAAIGYSIHEALLLAWLLITAGVILVALAFVKEDAF